MAAHRRTICTIIILICLSSTIILLSCIKINQENYDSLQVGMDYDEVLKILGKPDNCESILNMRNCTWEESSKNMELC
jgi:outer membrane protein assembly factor BamE (lipoprotein component of BamABCDE complex)